MQIQQIASVLILMTAVLSLSALEHPFMLVTEADYDELRERAERSPWDQMAADTLADATTLTYDASVDSYQDRAERARVIAAACALAYILDPTNAADYVARVESELHQGLDDLRTEKQATQAQDWAYNVMPAGAAFVSYLCLDIMYNDLDPTKRAEMEDDCDYIADNHRDHTWDASWHGIAGTKDLYHGDLAAFRSHAEDYLAYLRKETTTDGVFVQGCGYTRSRLTHEKRMQKHVFMDLCVRHDFHDFYGDPLFQKLYEWAYGYNLTPFRRAWTFGDAKTSKRHTWNLGALKVHRFSDRAARYVRWACGPWAPEDDEERRRLVHFILGDREPAVEALQPVSRVFDDGGAWFYEERDDPHALAIAMWNATKSEDHSHKDTNAIDFAAYGAHVLRNSSYSGWDSGDWRWIHDRAESGNTVLIDGQDHRRKYGAGIIEGLTGGAIDYARGDSGPALRGGRHFRNLFFIHPDPSANLPGYAILVDRIEADDAADTASIVLHPNSESEPEVLAERRHYRLGHTGQNWVEHSAGLDVFYASQPETVTVKTGFLAGKGADEMANARYLSARYPTNDIGVAVLATVLFPHDDDHPSRPMTAFVPTGATGGARVALSEEVIDTVLCSDGSDQLMTEDGLSFQAEATLYRHRGPVLRHYLVCRGKHFDDGGVRRRGFSCEQPISLWAADSGAIVTLAAETSITWYLPGISAVQLDGNDLPVQEQGDGYLCVRVPAGQHRLEFINVTRRIDVLNHGGAWLWHIDPPDALERLQPDRSRFDDLRPTSDYTLQAMSAADS